MLDEQPLQSRFFRRFDADGDPRELLDPAKQSSGPWGESRHGPCDKCKGFGETDYHCLACIEGTPATGCPACGGRVHYRAVCPACAGTCVSYKTTRRGISAFPSLPALYRYLVEHGGDFAGCVLVELEGAVRTELDLDADCGAVLVLPTRIVARHPVDHYYLGRVRRRLAAEGGSAPNLFSALPLRFKRRQKPTPSARRRQPGERPRV
jgi:hypothetical protein